MKTDRIELEVIVCGEHHVATISKGEDKVSIAF